MTGQKDTDRKKPLQLSSQNKLELTKNVEAGNVRQQFPHGRQNTVKVEVKRKRSLNNNRADAAKAAQEAQKKKLEILQRAAKEDGDKPTVPLQGSQESVTIASDKKAVGLPKTEAAKTDLKADKAPVTAPKTVAPEAADVKKQAAEPAKEAPAAESAPKSVAAKTDTARSSGKDEGGRGKKRPAAARSEKSDETGRGGAGRQGNRSKKNNKKDNSAALGQLTNSEKAARLRALQIAQSTADERRKQEQEQAAQLAAEHTRRRQELDARRREEIELEERKKARLQAEKTEREKKVAANSENRKKAAKKPAASGADSAKPKRPAKENAAAPASIADVQSALAAEENRGKTASKGGVNEARAPKTTARRGENRRRGGKLTISQALSDDGSTPRVRSVAAMRRAREKERNKQAAERVDTSKFVRDVTIPETITVQELSNRMATRVADVIKSLMTMGVMATINQTIDADTAELVVAEFGHKVKRVSDADVEIGLKGEEDNPENMVSRAPVVTVMGHVDHGKTSLLDALRSANVAGHEAGGITQHIGAYQVNSKSGEKITFIDTPGHAAFTEMRSRGANVTDIVILVVAADDGIKQQTVEAISHAKSAEAPIIVAINKIDKPDANPDRVRQELLQHEIVVEEMGGDTLAIEISAKQRINLGKLEEAILLQSEMLELKADPKRAAQGAIVEAKMEQGRGAVATVLVQRGTLNVGDIFVAGREWGRVRAMIDHNGNRVDTAGPSVPVEVLGLNGVPTAGDELVVVETEGRAREIVEFRKHRDRERAAAALGATTLEQMFSKIQAGEVQELPVVIKSDVHGSLEAITQSLEKLGTDEVKVRVLHSGVGAINESDITLARASSALVIGFNVRANPQARDLARRDQVDIRYYSIIYNVVDDVKAGMEGLLSPDYQDKFLGYAEIREVFNISRVGRVAGCMITEGNVKRGSKVRLLRDNVVIHEGMLKTLRRFKDEVKEVGNGFECGMAFENYNDIQVGDMIECFEQVEVQREL